MKYSLALCGLVFLVGCSYANLQSLDFMFELSATPEEERAALQAYSFAFPMVIMEFTKRTFTNVESPESNSFARAPINQFGHARQFQPPGKGSVVRPNPDTLYTQGWLDLAEEPIILTTPKSDRYFVLQIIDMWTNTFASPGTRTTGNEEMHFGIYLDGWTGTFPEGVVPILATTRNVWIVGRTQTNGVGDYAHVAEIQNGMKLTPLSEFGTDYTPPASVPINPEWDYGGINSNDLTLALGTEAFFSVYSQTVALNPPHVGDWNIIHMLEKIGLTVGQPFNDDLFPDVEQLTLKTLTAVRNYQEFLLVSEERWTHASLVGSYATNYAQRSLVTLFGLVANFVEDAYYFTTAIDEDGNNYNGAANAYFIDFPTVDDLPPVDGFWSVTLYDGDGYTVENAIDRVAIGDRDVLPNLPVRIVISAQPIDETEGVYWLPAPVGEFNLMMRLYFPKTEALLGSWTPPAVQKVGGSTTTPTTPTTPTTCDNTPLAPAYVPTIDPDFPVVVYQPQVVYVPVASDDDNSDCVCDPEVIFVTVNDDDADSDNDSSSGAATIATSVASAAIIAALF